MLAVFYTEYSTLKKKNYGGKIKSTNIVETLSHQVSVTTGPIFLSKHQNSLKILVLCKELHTNLGDNYFTCLCKGFLQRESELKI